MGRCQGCNSEISRKRFGPAPKWCAQCRRERETARHHRYVSGNRGRIREHERRRGERDREKRLAQKRQQRDARTPAQRAAQSAYLKAWREANPEKVRELARRGQLVRRARKLDSFVERVDPVVVLADSAGLCGICGVPVDPADFHVDHIVPLSRGGEHSYVNVQPAHPRCNRAKGARVAA